jgi:hypothetical protein
MQRTYNLVDRGLLTIYEDLEKNEYYNIVNDSRVVFNCALQDWVSSTSVRLMHSDVMLLLLIVAFCKLSVMTLFVYSEH